MDEKIVKHLVDRLLQWNLPADFSPDAGISYTPREGRTPLGTNLFSAKQAEAMVRHMLEQAPTTNPSTDSFDSAFDELHLHEHQNDVITVRKAKEICHTLLSRKEEEVRRDENDAWLYGKRCKLCGGKKKENIMWDTCEECD